jgi:hypothetical protein
LLLLAYCNSLSFIVFSKEILSFDLLSADRFFKLLSPSKGHTCFDNVLFADEAGHPLARVKPIPYLKNCRLPVDSV